MTSFGRSNFQPRTILQHADYSIACICPMGIELAPVEALLDEVHDDLPTRREHNNYSLGRIGVHNIVITVLSEIGNNSAAIAVTQLLNDFPSVRYGFVVGIGGGLPTADLDIRLGDVVVSQAKDVVGGVVQYDRGKILANGEFRRTGSLNKPPPILSSSIERLKAKHAREGNRISDILHNMIQQWQTMSDSFRHPGPAKDKLFASTYRHEGGSDCASCRIEFVKQRPERPNLNPVIHYGAVGSANIVVKDAFGRDMLSKDLNIICVEMEAAGVLDILPCIVIRGVCDYADSHKNKEWQPYAAAVAAAYLKELMYTIPSRQGINPSPATERLGYSTHLQIQDSHADAVWSRPLLMDTSTIIPSTNQHELQMFEAQQRPNDIDELYAPDRTERGLLPVQASSSAIASNKRQLQPVTDQTSPAERPHKSQRSESGIGQNDTMRDAKDFHQALIDSLKFDQMDSRHATIRQALATTCGWFLDREEFRVWLDDDERMHHHGFLWIKGKPAAGKSTLMKFLLANAEKAQTTDVIVAFFFHARGGELEKSIEGMYRSLISQVLEKLPASQLALGKSGLRQIPQTWTIELLQNLFSACVKMLGNKSLTCFIDALDECPEDEVREMVAFLEELAESTTKDGTKLLICFSSRHYPSITIAQGKHLILEDQEGHTQDLAAYLTSKLKGGRSPKMAKIKQDILERASGVFLWVVLVVKLLNKINDAGRVHKVKMKLEEIPDGLQDLFEDILTRDYTNTEDLTLCLQWILHAKRPLSCEELYCAVLSQTDPEAVKPGAAGLAATSDEMARFVLDASKGLAEKTKGRSPRVQFIHESVREFFLQHGGLKRIRPELHQNLGLCCHEKLKDCCKIYWNVASEELDLPSMNHAKFSTPTDTKVLRNETLVRFPFLEYATRYILDHANFAAQVGTDQSLFLTTLNFTALKEQFNFVKRYNTRKIPPEYSLLDIVAERGHFALLLEMQRPTIARTLGIEPKHHRSCVFNAIHRNDRAVMEALLKLEHEEQPNSALGHELLTRQESHRAIDDLLTLSRFTVRQLEKGQCFQDLAVEKDAPSILKLLSANDMIDIPTRHLIWGSERLLVDLAKQRKLQMFRYLLPFTQSVLADNSRASILAYVASNGWLDLFDAILDGNEAILYNGMPIQYITERADLAVVKHCLHKLRTSKLESHVFNLLFATASERGDLGIFQALEHCLHDHMDMKAWPSEKVFSSIIKNGHQAILEYLLRSEKTDLNTRYSRGRTPLLMAAQFGSLQMIKMILDTGKADQSATDVDGVTAFLSAVIRGDHDAVQLLLDHISISHENNFQQNAFWLTAFLQHEQMFEKLLDFVKDLDCCSVENPHLQARWPLYATADSQGRTVLMAAAVSGALRIVEDLLATTDNIINATDTDGNTAVTAASVSGFPRIVELLLRNGATEMMAAKGNGAKLLHKVITKNMVLEQSLRADDEDFRRYADYQILLQPPQRRSVLRGTRTLQEYQLQLMLLEQQNKKRLAMAREEQDITGNETADTLMELYFATEDLLEPQPATDAGHAEVIEILVKHYNIDVNDAIHHGQYLLHTAVEKCEGDIIEALLNLGADPELGNASGMNALRIAIEARRSPAVEYILASGIADIYHEANDGRTPLSAAMMSHQHYVVRMLVDHGIGLANSRPNDNQSAVEQSFPASLQEAIDWLEDKKLFRGLG